MGTTPKDKEEKMRKKPGRVPTSCAECRRLKLRCDKNVPCGKCVSRGCGSICPDGHLTSGKGNRLVLANTEELHDRIENLCARIRELEDALRVLQESVTDRPHPLLRTDLLHIKTHTSQTSPDGPSSSSSGSHKSSSTLPSDEMPVQSRSEEENFIDMFGTLSIGLHGESNFLGQTARSEYLFRALAKVQPSPVILPPRLSSRIVELSFPYPDVLDRNLGQEIFELLPPSLSAAMGLVDTYLEHGAYLPITLQRKELLDDVLEPVYRAGSFENLRNVHALSLLFVVFATAALLDPTRHPYSMESQEYYYLSRAALGLASPARETTLAAIQALIHMAQYLDLSDWEGTASNAAWIYIGTAVRLAHGIGLHLNSSRWHLSEEASERRSRLFWQLFLSDTAASFSLGRPPSMSTNYIDCPYPKDIEVAGVDGDKEKEISFFLWSCKYSVVLHSIMSSAFGSKVPPYNAILDLDRKIRDYHIPTHLQPTCTPEVPRPLPTRVMQRFLALTTKESTLLNLHRAYFAQALQDKPEDLANHRFIPSVMATYRSAWRLIRGLVMMWRDIPMLLSRVGSAWSPALSAAIVMCILVTRAPTSKLTKSSLEELDALARLFEDAAPSCRFASNLLSPILVLTRRAHQAVDENYVFNTCEVTPADLDRLGGKTHLISQLSNVTTTAQDTPSPPSPPGPPTPPAPTYYQRSPFYDIAATSGETMHPTIAQDMRSFDLGEPSQFYDTFPDAADMAGIQFTGDSIFGPQTGGYGFSPPPAFQTPSASLTAGAPPMLDATWQSFVEQLGF
ncbi:fungal-specific transcription factor domain-containing protein [Mycena maculata]|uniref:Fungal-specific transcription factor domain-containing protein n=1 Tax=Mycena maculata TaxID=230809 RepID=A0AAD7MSU5_9AGAR|nr:fungal-specific transcription factor domain-containing protein [Mycena maculata]